MLQFDSVETDKHTEYQHYPSILSSNNLDTVTNRTLVVTFNLKITS